MSLESVCYLRRQCHKIPSVARAMSEGSVCQPQGNVRRKSLSTTGQCQKEESVKHRAMSEGRVCQPQGSVRRNVCQTQANVRRKSVNHRAMSEGRVCQTQGNVRRKSLSTTGQCQKEESVKHRAMSEGRVCQPQGSVRRNVCQTQGNVRRKSLSTTTVVSGSSVQQCEVSTSAPCTFFSLFSPFLLSLLSALFRLV